MFSNIWSIWNMPLWMVILFIACVRLKIVIATNQYHIQTDEGPERFFRFQTDNGQFRKEKRLQDGTVIGTDAWIDAAGYLRLKDYMADKHGYRILKSKVVYVGRGTDIQDAIKYAKSTPAQSGILVTGNSGLLPSHNSLSPYKKTNYGKPPSFVSTTTTTTTEAPILGYLTPWEAAKLEPIPYLGFDHYPNELPSYGKGYVRSKANYYQRESNTAKPSLATLLLPPVNLEPPLANIRRRIQPIGIASTTPAPITTDDDGGGRSLYATPIPFSNSFLTSINDAYLNNHKSDKGYNYASPYGGSNLRPIYDRHRSVNYNDITSINNGFRYVLPHQYHEEAEITKTKKAGSYGYVDPFGIRRVVYYNASPEKGFVYRNHNRYVGLGAAPYDEPNPTDV